jgi:hypothetical protein
VALEPRFRQVAERSGHYESFYVAANHPTEPIAVWIRCTVRKPPGGRLTGSVWFTLFEPDAPTAAKVTTEDVRLHGADLLVVGDYGAMRRDGTDGQIDAHGSAVAWKLRFDTCDDELRHLPYRWMYRAGVPRTKATSPCPSMLVTGTVTVAGRTFHLDGWPGMLGHNWGSEHAYRWCWLRGALFAEGGDAWIDVVLARIRVGRGVLPWVANGAVVVDGVRHRIGGLARRVSMRELREGCELVLPGRDVSLAVKVTAPLAATVGWEYRDPAGGRRQVRNCSIAAVSVEARHRHPSSGGGARTLTTEHGGVYELGTSEFDTSVPMQPYPDN